MQIENFITLSTSHLTADTLQLLSECVKPDDLPFIGGITQFGYWAYAYAIRPEGTRAIPDDLWACMDLTGRHCVKYILFDADAATSPDLPTYEH